VKFEKYLKKKHKPKPRENTGRWMPGINPGYSALILPESLVIRDEQDRVVGKKNLKFTKKNIEKVAYQYDAEVQKIEMDMKHATLKDNHGRLLFIDEK